eukprot:GILJ01001629.1.p1 GENE.GILJ01001629.1~~GILJ01001629.1.p1  ORF type:complete len:401 (-),score=81.32 GILJ01001629.1:240-1442(-)
MSARKKERSRRGRREESDDDGSSSMSSLNDNASSGGGDDDVVQDATLEEKVELLTEKRATIREHALKDLIAAMRMSLQGPLINSKLETLITSLMNSIKKGQAYEAGMACQALSLVFITLGAESEAVYAMVEPQLAILAKDHRVPATRAAIIKALSMVCLIGCPEDEKAAEIISLFESFFEDTPSDVTVSALNGWGLLSTLKPVSDLAFGVAYSMLPTFKTLLENEDADVRAAAGENVALLYDASWQEESADEAEDLAEILNHLQELAADNSRYMARRDRKEQRLTFREFQRTVESGEVPEIVIKIGSEQLELNSWSQIKQYEALTDILESGMPFHLAQNLLLRDMFDLGEVQSGPIEKMTTAQKKAFLSESAEVAKARDLHRTKNRKHRARIPSSHESDI